MQKATVLLLIGAMLVLAGCAGGPPAPAQETADTSGVQPSEPADQGATVVAPTAAPDQAQPTEAEAPAQPSPEAPADQPTATPAEIVPLAESWLLFGTSADGVTLDAVWAASSDGTTVKPLAENQQIVVPFDWDMSDAMSPDGSRMAVITSTDVDFLSHLWLNIISIPDGGITPVTPLTSPTTEPAPDLGVDDPNFQIARALAEVTNVAWSADSRYLAFAGASVGTSSDVYLYDTVEGNIRQITNEAGQAIRPTFSPDGLTVVYAEVSGLGTGAGFGLEAVRAVDIASAGSRVLYQPQSGDEQWVGWASDRVLIAHSWNAVCGLTEIRTVDIDSGDASTFWPEFFSAVAYHPASATLMVAIDGSVASCNTEHGAGVYAVSASTGEATILSDAPAFEAGWSDAANAFVANIGEGRLLVVDIQGAVVDIQGPTFARYDIAPDGTSVAWAGVGIEGLADSVPGLWIGPLSGPFDQVSDQPFFLPRWAPDGDRLFAFSQTALYTLTVADPSPVLVVDDLNVANWVPVWVRP